MQKLVIVFLFFCSVFQLNVEATKTHADYLNTSPQEFFKQMINDSADLFPICNQNNINESKKIIDYEPPEIISMVDTIMPTSALRRNIDGLVVGKIFIDDQGYVTDIEIIHSYPEVSYFESAYIAQRNRYKYKPAKDLSSGKNVKSFIYDAQAFTSPEWLYETRRLKSLQMGGMGMSYINTLYAVYSKATRGYIQGAKDSVLQRYQDEDDPIIKASYFYLNSYIDILDLITESWDEEGKKAFSIEGDFDLERYKSKFYLVDNIIDNLLKTREMYEEEIDKSIFNYLNPLVLKLRYATSLALYTMYLVSYQDDLAYEEASIALNIQRNYGLELTDYSYSMFNFIGMTASKRNDWCNAYYAFDSANKIKDHIDNEFRRSNNKRGYLHQDITAELNARFEDKNKKMSLFRDYIDDRQRMKYFQKAQYEFALELSRKR